MFEIVEDVSGSEGEMNALLLGSPLDEYTMIPEAVLIIRPKSSDLPGYTVTEISFDVDNLTPVDLNLVLTFADFSSTQDVSTVSVNTFSSLIIYCKPLTFNPSVCIKASF